MNNCTVRNKVLLRINFNQLFIFTRQFCLDKDVIMDGLTAEECKQSCIVSSFKFKKFYSRNFQGNVVGTEVFPCKAYVYSTSKRECRLSAETGMIPQNTTKKPSGTGISSELSSISAGQYFEKFCLEGRSFC